MPLRLPPEQDMILWITFSDWALKATTTCGVLSRVAFSKFEMPESPTYDDDHFVRDPY